jgi:quinolinate synthase
MFGADVTRRVRDDYPEAMVAAHLEVPGEMFALGMERSRRGRGVVGSTSNILDFIVQKLDAATDDEPRLSFVLGTEAGMITSIVKEVRERLRTRRAAGRSEVEVEIVFPVASEAIAQTGDAELAIVPGVAAGEGCTVAGGCATCPFMKMNSLDSAIDLLRRIDVAPNVTLMPFHPREYAEQIGGRSAAELGGESILHMRHFQKTGRLSDDLVRDIRTRHAARGISARK